MKILFFIHLKPVLSGGAYHYMNQALALEEAGHEIHTLTDIEPHFPLPNNEVNPTFITQKKGFDLIISNHYTPIPIAFEKAKEEKSKFIMTMCEPPNLLLTHMGRRHEGEKPEWDQYVEDIAVKSDGIITISKFCAEWIYKWVGKTAYVNYPKVNCKIADNVKVNEEKDQMVFISRLDKYKNFDWAIKAAAFLKRKVFIIGGGAYAHIRLIHKLGSKYGAEIYYIRWASEKEKFRIIKQSKVLIHPSSFEGFGWPPAEGLYCQKPVVAQPLEVLKEVYGDCVNYVNNFDHFLVELQMLFDSSDYRRYLGKCGRKLVENSLCEENFIKTMDAIAKEVVSL